MPINKVLALVLREEKVRSREPYGVCRAPWSGVDRSTSPRARVQFVFGLADRRSFNMHQEYIHSNTACTLAKRRSRSGRQTGRRRHLVLDVHNLNLHRTLPLDLESLAWRRHVACLLELHHILHCIPMIITNCGFSLSNSERRPMYINYPPPRRFCVRSFFLFTTSRCWNSLPTRIRKLKNYLQFKKEIKIHFENCKYNPKGFILG